MKKKLFVISSRVPYPLDKGDKLRLYHQLRLLADEFDICLCAIDENGDGDQYLEELKKTIPNTHIIKLSKWLKYLNTGLGLLGRKPLQVYYFYQGKAKKEISRIIKEFGPDHIYCQLIRAAEYVKDYHHIKKTIDYQDAFSKGVERRIEKQRWLKYVFKLEHRRLLKYENLIYDYFDYHTIISEEDRNYIFHENRQQIVIIPNGIDSENFAPKNKLKECDLLFVGNMSYAPNIDAVSYIANEIIPLIVKDYPEIKFRIAGANPSSEVKKLQSKQIEVTGWIDDIRDAYWGSKIFLAPMRIGSGLQNKLLEAMACEIPVVTSPLANRSLKAEDHCDILIAKEPKEIAQTVIELLNNQDLYSRLSENGRKYVMDHFSWDSSVHQLSEIFNK